MAKASFVPALVPDHSADVATAGAVQPLATDIRGLAVMLGCSTATVRRRMKDDPEFPRLFRYTPGGEQYCTIADARNYIALKSGRAEAA
jgi:hypothetical protein